MQIWQQLHGFRKQSLQFETFLVTFSQTKKKQFTITHKMLNPSI